MSLNGRISELSNKHRQLDQKISETQKHPSVDPLELKQLKLGLYLFLQVTFLGYLF
mgnify:CR=1 FL=1